MGAHRRRSLSLPLSGGGAPAEAPVMTISSASPPQHLPGRMPPLGLTPDPQGVPLEPKLGTGAHASFVADSAAPDERPRARWPHLHWMIMDDLETPEESRKRWPAERGEARGACERAGKRASGTACTPYEHSRASWARRTYSMRPSGRPSCPPPGRPPAGPWLNSACSARTHRACTGWRAESGKGQPLEGARRRNGRCAQDCSGGAGGHGMG